MKGPRFLPGPTVASLLPGDQVAFETKGARPMRYVGDAFVREGVVYLYSPTDAFVPYRATGVRLLRVWREGKVVAEVVETPGAPAHRRTENNAKLNRLRASLGKGV